MDRPKLALDFSFHLDRDKRSGPFIDTDDETTEFSEEIELQTTGYVYHPALLTYTFELNPEWEQTREKSLPDETRTTKTFFQGYFGELMFLQYKPYTLILTASRDLNTLRSNFAELSKAETETYGARLLLKNKILPTTLDYKHTEGTQTGFFESDTDEDTVTLNAQHEKFLGSSLLNATYSDSSQKTRDTLLETNQYSFRFNNTYRFKKTGRTTVNTSASYRATDGTNTRNRAYNVGTNINHRHRYNLSSQYRLRYDKDNTFDKMSEDPSKSETKSAGFKLTHTLYENLRTSFDFDATQNKSSGGRTGSFGPRIDFTYNRRIPWGSLNLTTGFDYKIFDNKPRFNVLQVFDEPSTLINGDIVLLANQNINISSIRVTEKTSADGDGIIYEEDIDYELRVLDSFVRIVRKSTGLIADGQTVYVDYSFEVTPAFDYSLFSHYYGARLNLWNAWTVYFKVDRAEQELLRGTNPDELTDNTIYTAGTELVWKWTTTSFEWEDWYTTNVPVERWRAEEVILLRPRSNIFLRLLASYNETTFKEEGDTEETTSFAADTQFLLSERSFLTFAAFWDKITSSTERSINKGFSSGFEWSYRIWRVTLTYDFRNENDELEEEEFTTQSLMFKVERTLF